MLTRATAPAKRKKSSTKKPASNSGQAGASSGLGGTEGITVKGKRATAAQREVIDGCLQQAQQDGASRRVMIAVIMTITQESTAGDQKNVTTGNDDTGIFQQGRNWISVKGAREPGPATHAFLVTGPTSWKKVHGGLKNAPGDLEQAIKDVQISVGGYKQWQAEATKTVDAWLGGGGGTGQESSYRQRYEFTRGERGGQRETSWDASARLVEEVTARRWAAMNVFYAVSDEELSTAAVSVTIHGDEPWLVTRPSWSWAAARAITQVTLQVVSSRWNIMPGAVVVLGAAFGPAAGRYLVWNVAGDSLDDVLSTVILQRPTALRPEPAAQLATRDADASSGGGGGALLDAAEEISGWNDPYIYGGGHSGKLSTFKKHSPKGLDCSSSCSLALSKAGMFDGTTAITSGTFASSWGKKGKGKEFTVWANAEHVWIEGYDSDGKFSWRFDTSPHGDGPSGPHVRRKPRNDQGRFTARHWSGH